MKTFITTAIAAFAFMFATNIYANTTTKPTAHHDNHHEVLVKIVPTMHCHCKTCNDLVRMHNHHHNYNMVKATNRCNCHTCNDIRHNDRVKKHRNQLAYNTPAKPVPPRVPAAPAKVNRTGNNVVAGHR
ncbi:MAG: hypothetical protein KBT29_09630 [Prevotellaceae bacterium]|nr:hypothetical protein [Candidatus Minthosoma caballi]